MAKFVLKVDSIEDLRSLLRDRILEALSELGEDVLLTDNEEDEWTEYITDGVMSGILDADDNPGFHVEENEE